MLWRGLTCAVPRYLLAHHPMPIYSRQEEKASGQLIHILHSYKWVDADEIVEDFGGSKEMGNTIRF